MTVVEAGDDGAIDPRRFRDVLGAFPTGVVVVGATMHDGETVGMVVGSFTSVSLDPPLVAFLPSTSSQSYARLRESESFCVSVLSADQEALCRRFASREPDKFAGVAWSPAPTGSPRLDEAVAWIDCRVRDTHRAGDHDIVVGDVVALGTGPARGPLLFFQGGYGGFDARALAAPYRPDLRSQLRFADLARPELELLADRTGLQSYTQSIAGDDLVITAACGDLAVVGEHIGRRLPLAPPFGSVFAAADAAVAKRLAAAGSAGHDAAELDLRLERVRRRGWSIGLHADDHDERWSEIALHGDAPETTAVRARVDLATRALMPFYDPDDDVLEAGELSVRIITAPVRDAAGAVVQAVALFGLPHPAPRSIVLQWIDEAVETAARISRLVAAIR